MATETQRPFVLPGESIDHTHIPSHPKKALRLGPGLRHIPPNELVPTVAGQLVTDPKKNSIWVEYHGGRYIPSTGDLVIGTVTRTSGEYLYVSLSDYTSNATLPQLAFEMATKKTKPNLSAGALVYARVSLANRHMDPELECVSATTGKAEGLGPLVGGMLFEISLAMARRLLMRRAAEEGGVVVLDELGGPSASAGGLAFETAVGRNGKLWVNSESTKTILAVGRAVVETDEQNLSVEQQKKLVRKLVKDMS
ncbi:hypothetical protein MGN70_013102 [Eutypa lata]|uniref:Ribosomal RNA-processing protein 40 n=1 Tax=Eutypa lata (strain UCR-EL1) TaxID=1287681 RepID=M7TIV4_EUTLA|nr:putative exosome complex exonuclease rrp40 protein [Eutypa lata UCREL1]KAI1246205.1 hypothetical protein MGN70_013102 [Eutypa lata]